MSLTRLQSSTFYPTNKTLYVAVSNTGSSANKEVRALYCNSSAELNEITNSATYDLYTGTSVNNTMDITLDLAMKDSYTVITVGVPESGGSAFPILTEDFPKVFATN